MTSDYLKLTAYFGERARAGNHFCPTPCWISTAMPM